MNSLIKQMAKIKFSVLCAVGNSTDFESLTRPISVIAQNRAIIKTQLEDTLIIKKIKYGQ